MHRPRTRCRLTVPLLCVFEGSATASRGQCPPHWLPGHGIPGVPGTINMATRCDPDGPGPQPELLIVGGDFMAAGTVSARSIAAWDGARWSAFGGGLYWWRRVGYGLNLHFWFGRRHFNRRWFNRWRRLYYHGDRLGWLCLN